MNAIDALKVDGQMKRVEPNGEQKRRDEKEDIEGNKKERKENRASQHATHASGGWDP